MDSKTLHVLEYPKVLERLAAHCDFSASMQLARELEPTTTYELALARLQETTEARKLFSMQDLTIGGETVTTWVFEHVTAVPAVPDFDFPGVRC